MTEHSDRAGSWADWQHRSGHLHKLSTALCPFGLLVRHGGPEPQLHVSDPRGTRNSAGIVVSRDPDGTWWYWWAAQAERITTIDDPDEAARRVARVICGVTE